MKILVMRTSVRCVLSAAVLLGALCGAPAALADSGLRVVATLSTFADIAETIGGEHVSVKHIAPARFNPHFIEPRPSDVLRVKRADLFIHGGLDLEVWRGPLLDAAGNADVRPSGKSELDLSQAVRLLGIPQGQITRAVGDMHAFGNPHYWTSPDNGLAIARAVKDKLVQVDPGNAEDYRQNFNLFRDQLKEKEAKWKALFSDLKGREIVAYHDQWPYLVEYLGLKLTQFVEVKPGIPPTPRHIEFLQEYITDNQIDIVAQASFFPSDASETLAERTGARLVELCHNVGEAPECSDFTAMLDTNIGRLAEAFNNG